MSEADSRIEAPDDAYGSLNHLDFGTPKVSWAVRQALRMLPPRRRRLLAIAATIQISLGVLDLLGIALVGLVVAVAVSGIGYTSIPDWAQNALDALGLGGLTISQLSVLIAGAAVLVLVLKSVASAFMTRKIMRFLAGAQASLSEDLARRFLSRPLAEVQRWTTSEAIYALGQGVNSATVALLGSSIIVLAELFLFGIVGITLLVYDPIITIAAVLFFAVVVFFLQRAIGTWAARHAAVIKDTSIETLNAVSEALSTYRETTVLDRRDLYVDRYSRVVQRYARSSASTAFLTEVPKYVLEIALYVGVVALAVGLFLTEDWGTAATTAAIFLTAGSRVVPSLLRMQGAVITVRNAAVMAQPTFYLYDRLYGKESATDSPDETRSSADRRLRERIERMHGLVQDRYPGFEPTVQVSAATLQFEDAHAPVLNKITFTLEPGQSLALVGATGAGKSTLADVILGVRSLDSGEVTIGGKAPRDAIATWPGGIAYVPQSVAIVDGSVRQNVALGIPSEYINDDLVREALARAHLDDFLDREREGINTRIGERGFKLSGGQRQRLGIARALYSRPKLLILDEATSALDSETEQAIISTMSELEGEVTTITIAHRLATVKSVDHVLYLSAGCIQAQGTFSEVRLQSSDFDRQATILGL